MIKLAARFGWKYTGLIVPGIACTSLTSLSASAAMITPDKVVVVILQDRASDAVGDTANWDYLNDTLVADGLVYSNSHGVTHPTLPNVLALYSGSTQNAENGPFPNGRNENYPGQPTLASRLFAAGESFRGYSEFLPADGSDVAQAGDGTYPDRYTRNTNPMAMFDEIPTGAVTTVNRTFANFPSDFSQLPTVSFVIPDNLHSAHGSNEAPPWAGSSDEDNNDILRKAADDWLEDNMDPYLTWAKTNDSLLIITQDEERYTGGNSPTITTIINGADSLFDAGVNGNNYNHYNLLRTLQEMYGITDYLGETANVSAFTTTPGGVLTVPEPGSLGILLTGGLLLLKRRRSPSQNS